MDVSVHGFGSVLLGATIMLRAAHELGLAWGLWQYLFLAATLLSSVMLIGAINLATNCIAFWEPASSSSFPFMVQNFL